MKARSQRGRIGDAWWSQRFIAVLESFGLGGRLERGKRYARAGQVLHMDITVGRVTAAVQGSRSKPYNVSIETDVLTPEAWDAAESVMASSAVFLAKLLAGEMPEEIEEAFAGSGGPLLPDSENGLTSTCSCPDWENPCKHIAAVYFLLAEAFDRDPFLILAWRGRDQETLLAGLRQRRHAARGADGPPRAVILVDKGSWAEQFGWPDTHTGAPRGIAEFWGRPEDIAEVEVRPRRAVAPDLVLRQLDSSVLDGDAPGIVDALRPLYDAITAAAAAEALGEEMPPLDV